MKRFHKKIGIICALLFCIYIMVGCEDAPTNKKQSTEQEESIEESLASEKYVSLSEAKEQIKKLEGQSIEGLHFPEVIQMPDVQSVSEIKLAPYQWNDEKDMIQAISSLWRDYNTVNWDTVKETVSKAKSSDYFAKVKTDKKTGYVYAYDTVGYFVGDSMNETELDISSCVAEYDFEWGDTASETDIYPMEDGEISVSDAVNYVENQLGKYLPPVEKNQFTYKIQHLYVLKNPDTGFHDYEMVIGRVYQGIALDTCSDFNLPEGTYYEKIHCGAHMIAIMRHKGSLDSIVNGVESLNIETASEAESVISPFWAVKQINQEIAHVGGLSFGYCGLFYMLEQDNGSKKDKEQGVYGQVSEEIPTSIRPMWVFMSKGDSASSNMTKDVHGASVLVDALDGSLWYYQSTTPY